MKPLTRKNISLLVLIAVAGIVLFVINPFQLTQTNNICLSGLVVTILLWTVDIFKKRYVSSALLVLFMWVGQTEIKTVFRFPLSNDFLMILYAYLFSQGIVNSRVATTYVGKVLNRFGSTPLRLILIGILFSIACIFIIPQPFARAILLATLFAKYLDERGFEPKVRSTVLLSLFVFATASYMLFRNGDVILNGAMLGFGGTDIPAAMWVRYLTVPTLVTGSIMLIAFLLTFRTSIFGTSVPQRVDAKAIVLSTKERYAALVLVAVVMLWVTESIHGLSAVLIIIAGTLGFYLLGFLKKEDLKIINIDLLFFLTAAFAIGPVMKNTGIAQVVFQRLTGIFPTEVTIFYFLALIVATMLLHMLLGSTITTLSVVIPGFLTLTAGKIDPLVLMMTTYVSVNIHYLLPFHHVTIMIGSGNRFIDSRSLLKFGLVMTFVVVLSLLFVYLPWWRFIGLL